MGRKRTRTVKVGKIGIGGDNPIRVQSMTSTKTEDIDATAKQIEALIKEGCEIIRIAVPNKKALAGFRELRKMFPSIPLVADIHFNYRLAIDSIEAGADKIRINPGNIGNFKRVKEIIVAAKLHGVPVRIGVNSGSLESDLIEKFGGVNELSLVESAIRWINFFHEQGFEDIVTSIKASSVPLTIQANRLLAEKTDHPIHLGVTEAGPPPIGVVKSAIGIGTLLAEGIGDTIRVSLTADPVEEVRAAWDILRSLELRWKGPLLISCPTCSRTRIDLIPLVQEVSKLLKNYDLPIKVAVMGCEVNGPGEARDADLGVAAGPGIGIIFRKGKVIKKVKDTEILNALKEELEALKSSNNDGGK